MPRDKNFWEEKLHSAIRTRTILRDHLQHLVHTAPSTGALLRKGRRKRLIQRAYQLYMQRHVEPARHRLKLIESKLPFYEVQLHRLKNRTVWDRVRRPEI
jgi:hypothetical protein